MMTPDRLRQIYGEPSPRAAAKVISRFDEHCRRFIERSSFLVIATTDGTSLDVSPKGDPAGFVEVETAETLLLPDRLGNNRIDGLMNILRNPQVALLFFIPTIDETLRVNGTAEILDDIDLCKRFEHEGRRPNTVLRITAEEIYLHCGKALLRAGLWHPEAWPTARPIPSLNEIIRDYTSIAVGSIEQSAVDELYRKTLY